MIVHHYQEQIILIYYKLTAKVLTDTQFIVHCEINTRQKTTVHDNKI